MSASEREGLLRRADDVVDHRFDLLGSGPTELGATIDWHRDFKSGRRWPRDHISRLRTAYPDGSDVKVPWELSRCQHLPLLAAAWRVSDDPRYLDELSAQLTHWVRENPVEFGVNWVCTMDVAIRAINWIAAVALCSEAAADLPWGEMVAASLLLHGRFIRRHLEFGSGVRSNHFLADVVGLFVLSAVFAESDEGHGWALWAVDQLAKEVRHQVRADGCVHEASTSYHRLVTELFIVGADAADAVLPGTLDPAVRTAIDRMLTFVSDYTRPDGLAPQIGDSDDARVLPLGGYGSADQRSHLHLFDQAGRTYIPSRRSVAYRQGGFFFLRSGQMYAAVRCGDVGCYGRGYHAHNDLLAFELCWGTTPLVVDPGCYIYTADPTARNMFRSTGVHSALQVDGAEQNEIRIDRLFAMPDRARAVIVDWSVNARATTLTGRHRGFEALPVPVAHTRTLRLAGDDSSLEVIDEIDSEDAHRFSWCLPLAPCRLDIHDDKVTARVDDVLIRIDLDGLTAVAQPGWLSPRFGVREPTVFVRLSGVSTPGKYRRVTRLRMEEAS